MHKNVPVLKGEYDKHKHAFSDVEILNKDHLPYGAFTDQQFHLKKLNHWIYWRGIPSYRVGLEFLLDCLNTSSSHRLLEKTRHISVSDTYWIKKEEETRSWETFSYWYRSYNQEDFARASFSSVRFEAPKDTKFTPNNTLNGFQRKCWMRINNEFVLYKGGTPVYQEEPINEWLASRIAEVLHIPHVHYDVKQYEERLISVCPNMCDPDTDLIPARDLLGLLPKETEQEFQLNYYIDLLKRHGILDASDRLDDMILMDFLMMNSDRHNQNMGVLVDANTMDWKGVAPVFDTGTGLGALVKDDEVLDQVNVKNCQLLNAKQFSHTQLLPLIYNIHRYDFNALKSIPQEYGEMLVKYQPVTHMTNKRINALYKLLYHQIQTVIKYQQTH